MGVTIPDLPNCPSDDNINLGEKDSIRRRALWALEGKPDAPCPKVEIPELSNADMERLIFDFRTSTCFLTSVNSPFDDIPKKPSRPTRRGRVQATEVGLTLCW